MTPWYTTPILRRLPTRARRRLGRSFTLFKMMVGVMWSKGYQVRDAEVRELHSTLDRHDGSFYLAAAAGFVADHTGLVLHWGWREGAGGGRKGVLLVLAASEQPALAAVDRLAHEYSFKDELDSTWAVRPLELVQDLGQTILVLEDPGGELLGSLLGTSMEVGNFPRIAVGAAAALGKVHQHGLIHKDVKPANILVNGAAGEEIRLTGFGVASRMPRERQAPDPPEVVAGTLADMAPEQTGADTPAEWPEEAVFENVNQLDRGAGVITSDQERKQRAELRSRDLG